MYFRHSEHKSSIYLLLYVDDLLIASQNKTKIYDLKQKLKGQFDMKELGEARRNLYIDISCDRRKVTLKLSQKDYSLKML